MKLFRRLLPLLILVGLFLALLAIHSPLIFSQAYRGDDIDTHKAGEFGSFIGGYFGTIILVFSVAVIAIQLHNQLETNERTSFESRFFELLKFHREDTSEIAVGTRTGRRVFVLLLQEFREVLKLVNKSSVLLVPDYSTRAKIDLAYMAFYYGVGDHSTPMLLEVTGKHPRNLVLKVIEELTFVQERYHHLVEVSSEIPPSEDRIRFRRRQFSEVSELPYLPFDGHQSRLAHYYRNLFQLIKYLDAHAPHGEQLAYADIVRAQLSNHEQALFCLNALSIIGSAWISRGYLEKYQLIKNIPQSFFDPISEIDLKATFPKIRFEFEKNEGSDPETNRNP